MRHTYDDNFLAFSNFFPSNRLCWRGHLNIQSMENNNDRGFLTTDPAHQQPLMRSGASTTSSRVSNDGTLVPLLGGQYSHDGINFYPGLQGTEAIKMTDMGDESRKRPQQPAGTGEMEAAIRRKKERPYPTTFRRKWNRAVRSGSIWPRFLYGFAGLALAGIWVGIAYVHLPRPK
jgi:hypothetical protein